MILHMIHWRHSSEHSMVVMMILAGLSVTMSTLLVSGRMGLSMATSSSLFVDTSGWAYLVDRSAQIHEALTTDHHFTQAGFVRLPAL